MRLVVNLIKFLCYVGLLAAIGVLTAAIALTHYQGEVAGLELMAFENIPLGRDPLVGWIFEAVTPTAGFANWTALGITGLIIVLSFLACHNGIALIRLLLEARSHIREGRGADLWHTIVGHCLPFVISTALLVLLLMGDMALFQFRALHGVFAPEDAQAAAQSIPAVSALAPEDFGVATIAFLSGHGLWMYLAMGIAPAVALELVGGMAVQTLAKIADEVMGVIRPATEAADAGGPQILYCYDAAGEPVFDPNTPIAYDADQNPVEEFAAAPAQQGDGWSPSNDQDASQSVPPPHADAPEAATDPRLEPVIGGAEGEEVGLADALNQPDRYHVERGSRAVYAKTYWDALQAEASAEPALRSNAEARKEAA